MNEFTVPAELFKSIANILRELPYKTVGDVVNMMRAIEQEAATPAKQPEKLKDVSASK